MNQTFFVKGDRVERHNGFHATMRVGDVGTVVKKHRRKSYFGNYSYSVVELEEYPGKHHSHNLRKI